MCRKLLGAVGIEVFAHVVSIGPVEAPPVDLAARRGCARARARAISRAPIAEAEADMSDAIRDAAHAGDTLGGVFEVVATGVLPGLGSHVQWDRKLDGRLAQALMSIQAIKGVEIGAGFGAARAPRIERARPHPLRRCARTASRARRTAPGGLEGGITNGMPVVCRAAMKPIATLKKALASVDVRTKEAYEAAFERSDVCAVAAASVVGEAMVCIVLADALLEKFGGRLDAGAGAQRRRLPDAAGGVLRRCERSSSAASWRRARAPSGPRLAARLGVPFVDTDAEIERTTGKTVPELWQRGGRSARSARARGSSSSGSSRTGRRGSSPSAGAR